MVLPVHGVFVGIGVFAATVVFVAEARRRGAMNEQSLVAVDGRAGRRRDRHAAVGLGASTSILGSTPR